MDREHRHLHREGEQEGDEDQDLSGHAQLQIVKVENTETVGLEIHVDQGDQHEDRAEKGIEEELDGRIDPIRSAPDPDNNEHRDQHRLPEHIEEDGVERREDADHHAFHDQKGCHVMRRLIGDDIPARDDHEDGDKGRQDNQRHRNAVDTQVVLDIEGRDPGRAFHELHLPAAGVETRPETEADREGQNGKGECDPLGDVGASITARQHDDAADDRQPDDQRQER